MFYWVTIDLWYCFNDSLDLIENWKCVYGVVSRSRLGLLSFYPLSVSFPSFTCYGYDRSSVFMSRGQSPRKSESVLRSVNWGCYCDRNVCSSVFCGARITPWFGGCMYYGYLCWAPVVTVLGGWLCRVSFHTGTFPLVVYFRVGVYFRECMYMVPTWNWTWGSRLRFRVKPVFPPPPLPSFWFRKPTVTSLTSRPGSA